VTYSYERISELEGIPKDISKWKVKRQKAEKKME
jgi:hypothetical protein